MLARRSWGASVALATVVATFGATASLAPPAVAVGSGPDGPTWAAANRTGSTRIAGQVPASVRHLGTGTKSPAQLVGRHPAHSAITLNFSLPLRHRAQLDRLIRAESKTHRYQSRSDLNATFAPPQAQYAALRHWLTSHGYRITHVSAARTSIAAKAPTSTVERSLSTRINDYRRAGFTFQGVPVAPYRFFSNVSNPRVPARLGVSAISGLTDVDRFFTSAQLGQAATSAPGVHSGPQVTHTRSGGYYPEDLRSMYDVSGHGVDATGQTLGFTLWGAGETQAAMTSYASRTGDTPITVDPPCVATANSPSTPSSCTTTQPASNHLESILENGNTNGAQGTFEYAGNVETALDIEQAHGMATGAAMKYYLADCASTVPVGSGLTNATCNGSDVGLEEAVEDAASDPTLHTVSNSWGYGGEAEWGANDPFKVATETSFALAAAAGTTFWFSTGDNGSYQSGYPADSQYVVGVGGTTDYSTASLGTDPATQATRSTATTWAGGGSWCSNLEPRPSWQTGPAVDATAPCPGRVVPDVSAIADTNSSVLFVSTRSNVGGTPVLQSGGVGGTSVAAPEMNGMAAVTQAFLAQQSYAGPAPAAGFEGPMLYQLGNSAHGSSYFNDVVCGNTASPSGGPDGDAAGAGWDPATGWGEIDWFHFATGYAIALGATGLSQPSSLDPGYSYGCAQTPTNASERGVSLPTTSVGYSVGSPSGSTPWAAKFLPAGSWGATNSFLKTTDGGTTWQTTNSDMLGVACPTSGTCVEIGDGGRIRRTTDNGTTWTYVDSPFTKALTSIQCPSASVCFAAGDRGTVLKSTDTGVTWHFAGTADGNALYGLSCPSSNVCYGVDNYGHVDKTVDGGATWDLQSTPVTTPGLQVPGSGGPNPFAGLFGVSCTDVNTCVAVGGFPPTGTDPPIVTTTDGGEHWTLRTSNAGTGNYLYGVDCVSTTCYAVGRTGAIVTSTDGGATWAAMTANTTVVLTGLTCSSASSCVATGQNGTVDVLSGGTWTPSTVGSNFLAAVSCATTCTAVGKQGATYSFDPASVAASATLQAGGGTTATMSSISCVDAADCVAVGTGGTILTTSNGGQTWLGRASGTALALAGVSCVASACTAVGAVTAGAAVILGSNDGGVTWAPQTSGSTLALTGVSCSSTTACVAVGSGGTVIATANGGAAWAPQTSGTTTNLTGVACPSATRCYAVGALSGATAVAIASTDGGVTWTAQNSHSPQALATIACTNDVACFAGGAIGTVVTTVDGGGTWAQQGNPISGPVTALNAGPTGITAIFGSACNSVTCVLGTASAGDLMTTPLLTVTVHASGPHGTDPALTDVPAGDPSLTYSPAGQAAHVTGTLTCTTTATSTSDLGSYPVSECSGLSDTGYSVVYDLDDSSYTVGKAAQTITFDPLSSPRTVGQTAPLTATGGASGNPVTFSVDATTSPAGACTVAQSGGAWTVSYAEAGSCVVDADQAGDAADSAAPTVSQTVVVQTAGSTVTLSQPAASVFGESRTVTATVTEAGGATPAGTVQFTLDGASLGAPVTVGSGGTATSPTFGSALEPGAHQIGGTFTPTDSGSYGVGTATPVTLVVGKSASATTLTIKPHQLTATVAPVSPGAGTPTGTVTFSIDGVTLVTAVLQDGTATSRNTVKSGKSHQVAVTYSGDGHFTGSSASVTRKDPTITAQVTSAFPRSTSGWYRSPVTVSFTCTTAGAPLLTPCPAAVTLSTDGGGQSVTRTAHATDGGASTVVVSPINIDQVAPRVQVTGVRSGGVYNGQAPKAGCQGSDALSGLASCTISMHTKAAHWHGLPGARTTYTARATDRAGNTRTVTGSYRTLYLYVQGVQVKANGAFPARARHTVTLVVTHSGSRPHYLGAARYPHGPSSPGVRFLSLGARSWEFSVTLPSKFTAGTDVNLGVKIGKSKRRVHIHVR